MSLALIVILLQTALSLLTLVNSNPALPQTMRDNAQQIAEQAISQATAALTTGRLSASNAASQATATPTSITNSINGPSGIAAIIPATCALTADKQNYNYGDTATLSWTSSHATSAFWQQHDPNGKDNIYPPAGTPSLSGSGTVVANVSGMPSVTLNVSGPGGGSSCTTAINVGSPSYVPPALFPNASATIDSSSLVTNNAIHYITGTFNDPKGVKVSITSSTGNVDYPLSSYEGTTWIVHASNYAPGTYTVNVYDPPTNTLLTTGQFVVGSTSSLSSATVTVNNSSLNQTLVMPTVLPGYPPFPYGSVTLSGTATNINSIYIVIAYAAGQTVNVSNGTWSATFSGMAARTYQVNIYDSVDTNILLTTVTLTVTKP